MAHASWFLVVVEVCSMCVCTLHCGNRDYRAQGELWSRRR